MSTDDATVSAQFFALLEGDFDNPLWSKLLLSKYRGAEPDLQRLTIRPIRLRDEPTWSFVYRYKTRDITKNVTPLEGVAIIRQLLKSDFRSAYLSGASEDVQLELSKNGKVFLQTHKSSRTQAPVAVHDREKKRFVDINSPFLTALGVTDKQRQLIPAMASKWKQINKFIEVFGQALSNSELAPDTPLDVVDFGSGKGYLTFALHDYLRHALHNKAVVTGVELRESLVKLCNASATALACEGLAFVCGDVKTHAPKQVDVMIALHACDTATDYAINYGIRAQAKIILCSPCCHKQIRPQMHSPALMQPMLQFGVHMGQQAEMVTDSLRALLLEAHGYSTKVFEFISLEHTDKNKMILAVKKSATPDNTQLLEQIAAIKAFYGIQEHCLEKLLQEK